MKTFITISLLASSFMFTAGCTALKSTEADPTAAYTSSGLNYRLPAKQYTLSTTYQITDCHIAADGGINLDADVKATLSERLVGAELYTLDYRDLDGLTKVTNTEIHLSESGLLTGINTTITDQSGAIVKNTVTTAAGIARGLALPATLPIALQTANDLMGVSPPSQKPTACDAIKKMVASQDSFKTALKAEQANDRQRVAAKLQAEEATAEISRLSNLKDTYKALGNQKDKNALIARIKHQEKKLAEAQFELNRLGISITEKAAENLSKATTALTIATTNDFLPKAWDESYDVSTTDNDIPKSLRDKYEIKTSDLPKVSLSLSPLTDKPTTTIESTTKSSLDKTEIGIAYRIPVAAMVRVRCECDAGAKILIETPSQVPQFGPIGSIDLTNGAFADNALEVAFNATTGAPDKLVFHSKSQAEAASAAASTAANAYLQLQKDKRDDIHAANKAALDQQATILALEKTRSDVILAGTKAAAATALMPLQTEQSIIEAQIDMLRGQQRLDAVRTGTASSAEVQLEALATQQKLLEEQLKIMKLEQQIAEQKGKTLESINP